MMGTSGQNEKLFATAIFGIVKFVSAIICALFLIDFIGRKRSLSSGIILQLTAMLYMALFLVIDSNVGSEGAAQTPSQKRAAIGAIVAIYISGFGWALVSRCPHSPFHLSLPLPLPLSSPFFPLPRTRRIAQHSRPQLTPPQGWNSVQYLINSEIYPLRLRALGGSIAMTFHFANQYGNSKAVPTMFISMTTGGTMFFFSSVTFIGLVWVWFFLPETSGRSLEAIDAIFELPWYLIGRKGKQMTEGVGSTAEYYHSGKEDIEMVEDVREENRKV